MEDHVNGSAFSLSVPKQGPGVTNTASKRRGVVRTTLAAAPLVLSAAVVAAAVVGVPKYVPAKELLQVSAGAPAAGVHLGAVMVLYIDASWAASASLATSGEHG